MLPQPPNAWFRLMLAYPCRKNIATGEADALQITMTHEKMAEINQLMTDAGKVRKPKFVLPGENIMLVVLDADKFCHIVSRLVLTLENDVLTSWFAELQEKGIKRVIVRTADTRKIQPE